MIENIFVKLDKYNKKVLNIYLILNVIWLFLGVFLWNYTHFSYQNFSTSLVFLFIINLLIILYANVRKKVKFDKIDIILILMIIFGIISTVFSKNVSMSLYGTWKRFEGLFQLLYYYSIFYLSSLTNNKKVIVKFILFFGLINVFVSFLQVFNVLKFIPILNRGTNLAHGLTGNSNFFGSYMVLCTGLSIGLFLYGKSKNILYLFLTLCFYSGLLYSNALSGMVGLFGIYLFIIIYFIYNIYKKKIIKTDIIKHIVLLVSCLLVSIILTVSHKTIMFKDIEVMFNDTKGIAADLQNGSDISDSYGNGRMYVWKRILKNVTKYWPHGVGIDCLLYIEEYPLTTELSNGEVVYFDKAHNDYLQKLITEGIFSFIVYLVFLFTIFIKSLKKVFKENKNIYLFLPFIGYIIQAFFNISVIEVAPLFFIISGLLYTRN